LSSVSLFVNINNVILLPVIIINHVIHILAIIINYVIKLFVIKFLVIIKNVIKLFVIISNVIKRLVILNPIVLPSFPSVISVNVIQTIFYYIAHVNVITNCVNVML